VRSGLLAKQSIYSPTAINPDYYPELVQLIIQLKDLFGSHIRPSNFGKQNSRGLIAQCRGAGELMSL
jgi:hypothetical protein